MNKALVKVFVVACLSTLFANVSYAQEGKVIPQEFHGTWTWNKDGIHPGGEEPLRISADEITAHETSGRVTSVVRAGKSQENCVVNLDAACEGSEGKERLTLTLSGDGQRLTLRQQTTSTCAFGEGVYYRAR